MFASSTIHNYTFEDPYKCRMQFPHGMQVGLSQCEHDMWQIGKE